MTQSESSPSRYEAIASELAKSISAGQLSEGERFSCRKLARRSQVSSETARRAMVLLEERGVVRLDAGSGAVVLSRARAQEFMVRYSIQMSARELHMELQAMVEQRRRLDDAITRATLHLLHLLDGSGGTENV
ncbi:MAG: GntR family transcriptional regulator [Firmicutes bacterium]|nr:GntR family transcriptional regulator [Bacillota bacterium]